MYSSKRGSLPIRSEGDALDQGGERSWLLLGELKLKNEHEQPMKGWSAMTAHTCTMLSPAQLKYAAQTTPRLDAIVV